MDTNALPPTKVDLSLVPLEDMIQEIFKRHHSVVMAMCNHKDIYTYQTIHRYWGHKQVCLALSSNLAYRINKEELESLKPTIEQ